MLPVIETNFESCDKLWNIQIYFKVHDDFSKFVANVSKFEFSKFLSTVLCACGAGFWMGATKILLKI